MECYASIFNVIDKLRPDECYHLSAQRDYGGCPSIRPNKLGDQSTLQLGSKRCIMDLEILLIRKFLKGEIYGIGELF
jgi:hypothetical protein